MENSKNNTQSSQSCVSKSVLFSGKCKTDFKNWFDEISDGVSIEPNAMSLATVDAAGQPTVRTVLLKGFDERGFVFFTNYESIC